MENEEKDTSNMEDDDFKKAEEESPPSSETELDDEAPSLEGDNKIVEFVPVDDSLPKFISQAEILKILSSRETLTHILTLILLLIIFGILSFTKSGIAEKLIITLGYSFAFGYFITANLNKFKSLSKLIRSVDASSIFVPLFISGLISIFIWVGLHDEIYSENVNRILSLGLIFIFIIWQFAQAWWMRIPFKEFALRKMAKYEDEGETKLGMVMNVLSPVIWAFLGFFIFNFISTRVSQFSENFDNTFISFWFLIMFLLGGITFFFLKQMHRGFWYNQKVASFSAYFALGYWGFLSYHAGVLLYSMYNNPSFVFDLIFMLVTIFLVIYSLSFQALRTEARRAHLKDTSHYMGKAGNFITRENVIFYAISFTTAYGASNFFLANSDASLIGGIQGVSRISHMIVILSGILVILIVNYNLLTGRGFIQEGFIDSIRNPKDN